MTHVYIVLIGYNFEGTEIDSVWSSQERANKRKEQLEQRKQGDYILLQVFPIDKGDLD
jgi:hypothetical protein